MSFPLWLNSRLFPMVPVFEGMPLLSAPLDAVLLSLFSLGIIASLFSNSLIIRVTTAVLLLFLLLQDQMRWQPWVYTYALVLLLSLAFLPELRKKSPDSNRWFLRSFQILMIGIYFWSGLNKLNPGFTEITYRLMMSNLFGFSEGSILYEANWLGYLIPLVEIGVALGLYFPASRKPAVVGAIFTHVVIMAYLFTMGNNMIVLPWNIAMSLFVVAAFWGQEDKIVFHSTIGKSRKKKTQKQIAPWPVFAVVLLAWLAPSLRFAGKWDNYLSFNLYSDNIKYLYIGVRGAALDELDEKLEPYYLDNSILDEGETIDVFTWSLEELNVPVYPERRVYQSLAKHFCKTEPQDFMFIEYTLPFSAGEYEVFSCQAWSK
ncbi:MAG: hypothetical protein GVY26_21575 [Bacteroidetes bacterium]|nr:hypothetical protein [Bacteroidota bacterium]